MFLIKIVNHVLPLPLSISSEGLDSGASELDSGTGFASGWSKVLEVLRVLRESLLGAKGVLKEGVFS